MTEENSAGYSGPLSPEELAECDRGLEESRRELSKRIDAMIERSINREINKEIYYNMD